MANRAETLDENIFTIADLKREGSAKMIKAHRGKLGKNLLSIISDALQSTIMRVQWKWSRKLQQPNSKSILLTKMISLLDNEQAYRRYKIRPRILVDVDKLDMSTEIFGVKVRDRAADEEHLLTGTKIGTISPWVQSVGHAQTCSSRRRSRHLKGCRASGDLHGPIFILDYLT